MTDEYQSAFRDVLKYPASFLCRFSGKLHLPVTYQKVWNDGFGARGWKLNATIGDPQIIASTRETGGLVDTSVFVHDMLDHFLSGFDVSGHRSEAMALIQLSKRTGSDPRPDYEQMVKEDILNGRVNGEPLTTFLPASLTSLLPVKKDMTNREMMSCLEHSLGETRLGSILVTHFFVLGMAGNEHAVNSWISLGLDPDQRTELGHALQDLLEAIDAAAEEIDILKAVVAVSNEYVSFHTQTSSILDPLDGYRVAVPFRQTGSRSCEF